MKSEKSFMQILERSSLNRNEEARAWWKITQIIFNEHSFKML